MDIHSQEEAFLKIAAWVQEHPKPSRGDLGDIERDGVEFLHVQKSPSGGFSGIRSHNLTVYYRPHRTGVGLQARLDYRERSTPEDLVALANRLKLTNVTIW